MSFLKKINKNLKSIVIIIILTSALLFVVFDSYLEKNFNENLNHIQTKNLPLTPLNLTPKYSIDTPRCKIPEVNPLDPELAHLIEPDEYTACARKPLLTYIHKSSDKITLHVNESVEKWYSYFKISCCYAHVERVNHSDGLVQVSACIYFDKSVEVTASVIQVSCQNIFRLAVYRNVHAIINPKSVEKKKKLNPDTTFSVLLVGIDSISKPHLERTMPKTFKFLENNKDFISMNGYTKIGLNTFPNLMGMLAGMSLDQVKKSCNYVEHVDGCYNIWKLFKNFGYVTAYGEDGVGYSSFNCCGKKGFSVPPTDYYFRPYMIAAEKLGTANKRNSTYCAGPETEAERIMNLAKDFQTTFKNVPKFGLFFMNSFSHQDPSMPQSMDAKVEEFLQELSPHLERTILVFFSDHGARVGGIRLGPSGWFEERVPFFYIHFPGSFRKKFPEEYKSTLVNSLRLTNPYNVYMTLRDVFKFATNYSIYQSLACPLCQSLFQKISIQNTCKDAGIDPEWCVCNYNHDEILKKPVINGAQFLVSKLNELVLTFASSDRCSSFSLKKILSVEVLREHTLLLKIETRPKAIFESFVQLVPRLSLTSQISRIDSYAGHSRCVQDTFWERYCHCKEKSLLHLAKAYVARYLHV